MSDEILQPQVLNRLMAEMRPRLHRYCARIVGSVFDGEDVVQETLSKALEAAPSAGVIHDPGKWLFTIAHHTALDALRRRNKRTEVPLESELPELPGAAPEADAWVAASASLATLMELPVIQRSTVVLMDVLEYSLAETAEILETSLPAVKAALHRARVRLQTLAGVNEPAQRALEPQELARLRSYAESFNARNFDVLRDLLAEDVRLDLVNRLRLTGRKDVSVYFSRYGESSDWKFSVGWAEGRPALLVTNPAEASNVLDYIVLLEWQDGRLSGIRDFRYAKYITDGLAVTRL